MQPFDNSNRQARRGGLCSCSRVSQGKNGYSSARAFHIESAALAIPAEPGLRFFVLVNKSGQKTATYDQHIREVDTHQGIKRPGSETEFLDKQF